MALALAYERSSVIAEEQAIQTKRQNNGINEKGEPIFNGSIEWSG